MFEKVLVPIDFTDESDRVLTFTKGLKPFGLKEITLVHVVDIGRAVVYPLPQQITSAIETRIEERRALLEREGFTTQSFILEGNPSDEILKMTRDKEYSLIVTGSHGKRLLEEILLGSVSEKISRESQTPVLLIRYDILKDIEQERPLEEYAAQIFRKVLFPSDFSRCSKEAMEVLKELKKAGVKEIVGLHIVDTKRVETETEKDEQLRACKNNTNEMMKELDDAGFKVSSLCRVGDPLTEILSVAGEVDASLILMGSHGKGVVREWLIGSVSLNVIRTADRPALVIHEREA